MKKLFNCFAFLLIISPGVAFADSKINSVDSTEEVWSHHIQAWANRDLDAIAADYDDTSIMIINGITYRGPAEIRKVFRELFEIFNSGVNEIDPPTVVDRIVFLTWRFTPAGSQMFEGTDTFVIENGVIKIQTIASRLYVKFPITK